ncbi:MAG: DUF1566 domain-containing protein [Myxococcaceae bacterium]|nr:DUF1566 domain-containing protein [Myxococcaceae bacterium]
MRCFIFVVFLSSVAAWSEPFRPWLIAAYGDTTNQTDRYQMGNDNTVIDIYTNLMWESGFLNVSTINLANKNCVSLFKNGYSDWRVPTVHEIQSLLDYVNAPGINEDYFTSLPSNESVLVTSSSSLQPTDLVLVVQQQTRSISSQYPPDMNVRCVRGPQRTAPLDRYTKFQYADKNFVKDQATGIGWMTESSAIWFCDQAVDLSQVWTPTIKAVFSLFNQSNPPLIDEAVFSLPSMLYLGSSTPVAGENGYLWAIDGSTGLFQTVPLLGPAMAYCATVQLD